MSKAIIQYKASDGQDVKLSPNMVAKYIVTGNGQATEQEIFKFMAQCQARGLNPLAGDAYMVSYRDRSGNSNTSVITSKDYFVRTATQQPDFDGMEAGVVVVNRDGAMEYRPGSLVGGKTEKLVGGWAKVHSKNRSHPSEAVVSLDEYSTGRSMWKPASQGGKPATMIRKVALVQAIREAYPVLFGGIYEREEMGEKGEVEPPAEVALQVEAEGAEALQEQGAEIIEEYAQGVRDEEDGYYEEDVVF